MIKKNLVAKGKRISRDNNINFNFSDEGRGRGKNNNINFSIGVALGFSFVSNKNNNINFYRATDSFLLKKRVLLKNEPKSLNINYS